MQTCSSNCWGLAVAHFLQCTVDYPPCLQFLNTSLDHVWTEFIDCRVQLKNHYIFFSCRLQHWITTRELSLWVMAEFWTMTMFWSLLEESEWFPFAVSQYLTCTHSSIRALFPSSQSSVNLLSFSSCLSVCLSFCTCLTFCLSVCLSNCQTVSLRYVSLSICVACPSIFHSI